MSSLVPLQLLVEDKNHHCYYLLEVVAAHTVMG